MSKQEIEIAIKIHSHAEELHKTMAAFRELRGAIASIRSPLLAVTHSADQFDRKIGELVRRRKDLKAFQESLKGMAGPTSGTGAMSHGLRTRSGLPSGSIFKAADEALEGIQTALGNPAAKAGLFAGKLIVEGIATGMRRNSMMEDQVVAFTPLLKSADEAKQRVAELSLFSANSRFDLPAVAQASRMLQQFGGTALSTGDGLRLVGDVAAATGNPIEEISTHMGQLYAGLKSGKPVEETTRRMVEMNLISSEQAAKLNLLAESGGATGRAYEVLGETFGRFGGTMTAQGETLGGLIHTLKETWLNDLGEMTEGLGDFSKEVITAFLELQGVRETKGQQLVGEAVEAFKGADNVTSPEDLEQKTADAKAKVADLTQKIARIEASRSAVRTASTGNFMLGAAPIIANSVDGTDAKTELDQAKTLLHSYGKLVQRLEREGKTRLENQQKKRANESAVAEQKKSEGNYGAWLDQNRDNTRHQIDSLRRERLSLGEQLDLERSKLEELKTEKRGLSTITSRPNEFEKKSLDLNLQIEQATSRIAGLEQRITAENKTTAKEKKEITKTDITSVESAGKTLEILQKTNAELSRKALNDDIQSIDGDWRMTRQEKYNYKRGVMLRELDGPVSNEEYDGWVKKQGPDPNSVADMYDSRMKDLREKTEAFADDFARLLTSPISGFQDAFGSALNQLLEKGATAGEFFGGIAKGIATSMRKAFTDMVTNWVTSHIVMKGVAIAYDGFLKLLRWAGVIDANKAEAAKIPGLTATATLSSIGSFGIAAVVGLAAIAGILASMGAFAEGGLTPGTRTLAWVGERGPELVLPADVTSRLSPQQQAMLLDGRLPAVAVAGDGAGPSESSRGSRTVRQNHYHYWDRAQMIADSRDDIGAIVHDVLRSRV